MNFLEQGDQLPVSFSSFFIFIFYFFIIFSSFSIVSQPLFLSEQVKRAIVRNFGTFNRCALQSILRSI